MENKISFKDLKTSLKIPIVVAWIVGGMWCIGFLVGFFVTMLE